MEAANAVVLKLASKEAMAKHVTGGGVFVGVRDTSVGIESATIKGAHRTPRGMIKFRADPADAATSNPIFRNNAEVFPISGAYGPTES